MKIRVISHITCRYGSLIAVIGLCVAIYVVTAPSSHFAHADGPGFDEQKIINLLAAWGETLQEWQPEYGAGMPHANIGAHAQAMTDLYADDASLLPTLSAELWRKGVPGKPEIKNYFEKKFLPSKPKLAGVGNSHIVLMGEFKDKWRYASYQGLYTFHLYAQPDGTPWPEGEPGVKWDDDKQL